MANISAEMPAFSRKNAPLITVGDADIALFINLVERLGIKRMLNTWHNLFTHPFCQFMM